MQVYKFNSEISKLFLILHLMQRQIKMTSFAEWQIVEYQNVWRNMPLIYFHKSEYSLKQASPFPLEYSFIHSNVTIRAQMKGKD